MQETARQELKEASERLILAQAERDAKTARIERLAGKRESPSEGDDMSIMQKYLKNIAELESEVKHLKKVLSPIKSLCFFK